MPTGRRPGSTRAGGRGRSAWVEADAGRGSVARSRASRAAARAALVDGDAHPDRRRPPPWFKATGPGPAHEGPLLEVFRRLGITHVLLPLAVHPDLPWMLFDDGGPTMRATRPDGRGDHDLGAWERILAEYAVLQRSLEGEAAVERCSPPATPDGRPERLPGELERLLDDDRSRGRRRRPDERAAAAAAARRDCDGAAEGIRAAGRANWRSAGVAATIQHDDLHGGNILVGPAGDRFFDWGDAVGRASVRDAHDDLQFDRPQDRLRRSMIRPSSGCRTSISRPGPTSCPDRTSCGPAALARDLGCIGTARSPGSAP